MTRRELTVESLTSLIKVYSQHISDNRSRLLGPAMQDMGVQPNDGAAAKLFQEYSADVLARRLLSNKNEHVMSSDDAEGFVEMAVQDAIKQTADDNQAALEELEPAVDSITKGLLDLARTRNSPAQQREEMWRWIDVALAMSSERGITIENVLANADDYDELMRRTYSLPEFMAWWQERAGVVFDANRMKDLLLLPTLKSLVSKMVGDDVSEKVMAKLMSDFEKKFMPSFVAQIGNAKKKFDESLWAETKRIWG